MPYRVLPLFLAVAFLPAGVPTSSQEPFGGGGTGLIAGARWPGGAREPPRVLHPQHGAVDAGLRLPSDDGCHPDGIQAGRAVDGCAGGAHGGIHAGIRDWLDL